MEDIYATYAFKIELLIKASFKINPLLLNHLQADNGDSVVVKNHVFGPIANLDKTNSEIEIDLGALIRRIILFEEYSMVSLDLREIPFLLTAFGYNGVNILLEEPGFRLIDHKQSSATLDLSSNLTYPLLGSPLIGLGHHFVPTVTLTRNAST